MGASVVQVPTLTLAGGGVGGGGGGGAVGIGGGIGRAGMVGGGGEGGGVEREGAVVAMGECVSQAMRVNALHLRGGRQRRPSGGRCRRSHIDKISEHWRRRMDRPH